MNEGLNRVSCLPSPGIASANSTPASDKIAALDLVSGGPTSMFFVSQESGAPRFAVNMTGIFASASSVATYHLTISQVSV